MEKKHKYWEIKERIKKDILNEVYKKGESIPSERDLAGIYDVTRVTVQKAMAMLVQEGYIERIHGKGMFVLKNTASNIYILNNEKSDSILGFSREFQGRVNVTSRLLTLTTLHADAALAQHLEIAQGDDVWFIRRIRLLDGQPVLIAIFLTRWLPLFRRLFSKWDRCMAILKTLPVRKSATPIH